MLRVGADMIYLAACALRSVAPSIERVRKMDIAEVYKMAKFHSMNTIVYISLTSFIENGEGVIDNATAALMRRDFGTALKKLFALEAERAALIKYLEDKGAWYLTLKGVILKDLYPKMGMRQMADNDILVNPAYAKQIKKYFVSRGYDIYSYGKGCHDVYFKDMVTFEIHHSLTSNSKKFDLVRPFCNAAIERSLLNATSPALRLSDEDFYVYFIYHTYKHFSRSGCGVRPLMDIYVYISAKGEALDFAYIDDTLRMMGLSDFEKTVRELSLKLFSSEGTVGIDELSRLELENLKYFITSGTFGTQGQLIKNNLDNIAESKKITPRVKLKYLLGRIFPPFEYYKLAHPVLHKFILTIPILWLIRLFRGFVSVRSVRYEIESLKNIK